MFRNNQTLSTITTVLPNSVSKRLMDFVLSKEGTSCLYWKARGTLLHESWLRRILPPIAPAKTMMQLIVPEHAVDRLVDDLVVESKLNMQATGAIFSSQWSHCFVGPDFHTWPQIDAARKEDTAPKLSQTLNIIHGIVGHKVVDKVIKGAIDSGAHGPIVYYSEGRGLRDRLGWLRITKESEKEVLSIIADDDDVGNIFDAMKKAGEIHLPGRGFMYRLKVGKGVFNIPSRMSHRHHAANIHQIINAIDHLAGHTHWRDQSVFDIGVSGRGVGIDILEKEAQPTTRYFCIEAITTRSNLNPLIDLMLDAGAPGLSFHYARYGGDESSTIAKANINEDYAIMRAVAKEQNTPSICKAIEDKAVEQGITDLCVLVNPVEEVATYVYKKKQQKQRKAA